MDHQQYINLILIIQGSLLLILGGWIGIVYLDWRKRKLTTKKLKQSYINE